MDDLLQPGSGTCRLLLQHAADYPKLQVRDVFKFLYQSSFGCEHLVSAPDAAAAGIREEFAAQTDWEPQPVQPLDGPYCRVPLSCLSSGLLPETLAKLFVLSAKKEAGGMEALLCKLAHARMLAAEGLLPFSADEFDRELALWKAAGYPAVRHSEEFRAAYHPSYRVIARSCIPLLPLLSRVDHLARSGRVVLAIEGGSASGKTTLGRLFSKIYDCTVLHMDDFFLQPHQRTAQRLAQPGEHVDWERFLSEVLQPLSRNRPILYRRFDCGRMALLPPVEILPRQLIVIEGAYCMHPALAQFYDLSVFLDVDPLLQRQRILRRNTPEMAERFFREWIPLEAAYFNGLNVKNRCLMQIPIVSDEDLPHPA